ncbi:hypothetical protein DPMN_144144 [Dreissena polymorpha]|uniref:Uncharacterized protein n=1 Tax=Dreissena polymorpha TaxID=45954 RepID=A0A9D4JKC5_DREPO|nr:hypothetical protein DPMN_144144 [Dreissena polymorpha]
MFGRRVEKRDDDSGWGSVRLLGRPLTDLLTDLLSCAARWWMRVRLSREAPAVRVSERGRLLLLAVSGPLGVGALVRGAACPALWELAQDTAFYD